MMPSLLLQKSCLTPTNASRGTAILDALMPRERESTMVLCLEVEKIGDLNFNEAYPLTFSSSFMRESRSKSWSMRTKVSREEAAILDVILEREIVE
jgi:hypothetical protein